jgi:hypothetical protein
MLVIDSIKQIRCFTCNAWANAYTEIFLHVLYEGSITCPKDHLLGNESDKEWQEWFGGKEC